MNDRYSIDGLVAHAGTLPPDWSNGLAGLFPEPSRAAAPTPAPAPAVPTVPSSANDDYGYGYGFGLPYNLNTEPPSMGGSPFGAVRPDSMKQLLGLQPPPQAPAVSTVPTVTDATPWVPLKNDPRLPRPTDVTTLTAAASGGSGSPYDPNKQLDRIIQSAYGPERAALTALHAGLQPMPQFQDYLNGSALGLGALQPVAPNYRQQAGRSLIAGLAGLLAGGALTRGVPGGAASIGAAAMQGMAGGQELANQHAVDAFGRDLAFRTNAFEQARQSAIAQNQSLEQAAGDITGSMAAMSSGLAGTLPEAFRNDPSSPSGKALLAGAALTRANAFKTRLDPILQQMQLSDEQQARFLGIMQNGIATILNEPSMRGRISAARLYNASLGRIAPGLSFSTDPQVLANLGQDPLAALQFSQAQLNAAQAASVRAMTVPTAPPPSSPSRGVSGPPRTQPASPTTSAAAPAPPHGHTTYQGRHGYHDGYQSGGGGGGVSRSIPRAGGGKLIVTPGNTGARP